MSKKTFLALGDSYTIGEGVKSKDQWPSLLAKELDWHNPRVVAKTGWTTSELLERLQITSFRNKYDYGSLLIGVNNQYRGLDIKTFQADFKQLLDFLTQKCDRCFVLTIPNYGKTPFGKDNADKIEQELQAYNEFIELICREQGIRVIDIFELSQKQITPKDLIEDQLHPSRYAYTEWATLVAKNLV